MTRKAVAFSAKFPRALRPMLCSLSHEPFDNDDYIFEIKWDGYRIISYKNEDQVRLESRSGLDYTRKYPGIVKALASLPANAVIDGEVVVLNAKGQPDFDALQKFNGGKTGAFYYVFDVLWLDGRDLTTAPLLERKSILEKLIGAPGVLRYSEHFENGLALYDEARALGLEGIVAKKKKSLYRSDKRTAEWIKIPITNKEEFVIGGWVESESGRLFRTLLFGAYKGKELIWIGHAGGGYKDHQMPEILNRLKALEIAKSPFSNEVEYEGVVHWVRPELVANIKYATTTRSGKIRKPAIFLGFRDDKSATQVKQETSVTNKPGKKHRESRHGKSNWSVVESQEIRNEGELHVEGCTVPVHNVDRVLWKGITKADLLSYYNSIAAFILPHLKERPLSLYLKLKGPYAPGVYIKDMEGRQPECADVFTTPRLHKKEGRRDVIDYLICNNIPTLLFMIDLGCVDVNPWTSRRAAPDYPDYIVIDLDPSDDDFTKAIETAQACRELFDRIKVRAFAKTSGKTGIHVFIPCSGIEFAQARIIATSICKEIHGLVPEITTTEVSIDQRGNRLYLDPNQNDFADTVASVYSVRPAHTPNVSCPLEWKEIKPGLSPDQFTMEAMLKRFNKKGDIFLPVLDEGVGVRNQRLLSKLFL